MIIQCTKKLADEMKMKVEKPDLTHEKLLNCWNAHIFKIGRTKCVMIMNNVSRYHFVIYGLLKKDFINLSEIIKKELLTNFFADEFSEDDINKYLDQIGDIQYTATSDRSLISQLNDSILITQHIFYEEAEMGNPISIYDLNRELNSMLMIKINGDPKDVMRLHLSTFND